MYFIAFTQKKYEDTKGENPIIVLLCVFTFWVPWCDVRYYFYTKMMFGSSLYEGSCLIYVICVCSVRLCMRAHVLFTLFVFVRFVFVWWFMSYLRYLCLFACSDVQHILCCVSVLFVFVLCFQFLWIVHFLFPLRYSLTLFPRRTGNTFVNRKRAKRHTKVEKY